MKAWRPCNAPCAHGETWGWRRKLGERMRGGEHLGKPNEFIFKADRWSDAYAKNQMYAKWADEYLDRLRDEL